MFVLGLVLLIITLGNFLSFANSQPYANSIMFSKSPKMRQPLEKEPLMLIVGEVTDNSVRIVYEWAPMYTMKDVSMDIDDFSLYVDVRKRIDSILTPRSGIKMHKNPKDDFDFMYLMMTEKERKGWTEKHSSQWKIVLRKTETRTVVNGNNIHGQIIEIKDREGPKSIHFGSLNPNTCYSVEFIRLEKNDEDDYVTFCTMASDPHSLSSNIKISAMSCNRVFEDQDTTTYDEYYLEHQESLWDLVVHMGDQVYADWVMTDYIAKINPSASFDDMLNAFRYVYRCTWKRHSIQRMFRHGSHMMIPDDHDIINNVDQWMIANNDTRKAMVFAGKEAFYEYQYQLMRDVSIGSQSMEMVSDEPIYYFRDIGVACLVMLDTRFERTFRYDQKSPLFGEKQLEDMKNFLSRCMNNENRSIRIKRALIFTSIPLLYFGENFSHVVYFAEREKYTGHPDLQQDVINFLDYLANTFGTYRVVFIAGDIHQFLNSRICKSPSQCFDQLITSGMSIASTISSEAKLIFVNLVDRFLFPQPRLGHWYLTHKNNLEDPSALQHSIRRNYGVIEMRPDGNIAYMKGIQSIYANRRDRLVQEYMFDKGSAFQLLTLIFLSGMVFPISVIVFTIRFLVFLCKWATSKVKKE